MSPLSVMTIKAITDAVFPQNAKNFLFWPRMERNLRVLHFDQAEIDQFKNTIRGCGVEVFGEQYGGLSYEDGVMNINTKLIKILPDEEAPSGFKATNEDNDLRQMQQEFIDVLDFQPRVREKFIQALTGTKTGGSTAEPAPTDISTPKAESGHRKKLIIVNKLARPAVNM
jgi:hypothetical protein